MSLALYRSALKLSRTSLLTWAIIILAYAFFVTYLYGFFKDMPELQDYYQALPEEFRAIFGLDNPDLQSFVGGVMDPRLFLDTEYLSWLPLMLSIFAVFYCGGLVSREAERGTLDLLLSRPLARYKLVLSKLATFLTMVVGLLAISWAGIAVGLGVIDITIDLGRLLLAHVVIFPLVFAVSAYCTLFSCLYLDPRRSLALAGIVTAAMYIVAFVSPILGSFEWIENLSLFHHLEVFGTLLNGTVNWTGVAVCTVVGVALLGTALVVFERRDLSY